jgi:hypothetical protein
VAGRWKILHNEELRNFYLSPNITSVMKSRRMGWAGHVTRMEEKRREMYTVFRLESLKGKRPLRRPRSG